MAYIQINFYSEKLKRNVPVNALIPNDLPKEQCQNNAYYHQPMKTLYLLPGYAGSHQDWTLNSHLETISQAFHMAIITPCGENSFYLDRPGTGFQYGAYVGDELVEYTRKLLGLSRRREDTYIGGFSMGGFGAIRNGLKYSETFSKIIALSSALILDEVQDMTPKTRNGVADYAYYHTVFGELKDVKKGDKCPEFLVKQLQKEKKEIPEIYMACGSEDFLIEPNRKFAAFLKEKGVTAIYEEGPGEHNWTFWNHYIERGVRWLVENKVKNG